LGGLDVRGYHAFNLIVHLLAGLTLFGIVRRTLERRGHTQSVALAWVIAVIWTVHPLLTESVTCVIQRTESLMGLFYLLTLYCFVRYAADPTSSDGSGCPSTSLGTFGGTLQAFRGLTADGQRKPRRLHVDPERSRWALPKPSIRWDWVSVLCCLAGVLTKEVMVTAPVMVLLYDRTFVVDSFGEAWRSRRGYYISLFATWLLLAYLVIHAGGKRGGAAGFGLGVTWWTYALTQAQAVVMYLKLAFWPHPLVVDYGHDVITHVSSVVVQLVFLAMLLAATAYGLFSSQGDGGAARVPALSALRTTRATRRSLGFMGAWFFLILAPSSTVVPLVTQTMAEHRMYLPLAAIVTLAICGLANWIGRRILIVGAAAAAGLAFLTAVRNQDYRTGLSIWQDTVNKRPDNARALNNLALELAKLPGRSSEAIARYQAALRLEPDYAEAHNNLAISLDNAGQSAQAIDQYQQALKIRPRYPQALEGMAVALGRSGHSAEAAEQFEAALRLKPDYADAHYNFAADLEQIPGRTPQAIQEYKAALELEPNYAEAHYNLANALAGVPGGLPEAITQYQEALRLKPDYAEAQNNLAVAYANSGRIDLAIQHFQLALKLDANFTGARENLEKLQGIK